jgi:hypothetical protein
LPHGEEDAEICRSPQKRYGARRLPAEFAFLSPIFLLARHFAR